MTVARDIRVVLIAMTVGSFWTGAIVAKPAMSEAEDGRIFFPDTCKITLKPIEDGEWHSKPWYCYILP